MGALLNLMHVSSGRDVKNLRKLHEVTESNIRGLKALGVDCNQ